VENLNPTIPDPSPGSCLPDIALLPPADRRLLAGYLQAKQFICAAGHGDDIEWAEGLGRILPNPIYVMREAAWVVLNSGFRYEVVLKMWPRLSAAFHGFDPAKITDACKPAALKVLHYQKKIDAIVAIAMVVREDLDGLLRDRHEPEKLCRLPFIGPVTCYHLAKLLGADTVKPDVHLTRAAKAAGTTPQELCRLLGCLTGDRVTTADSVLWRWGQLKRAREEDWAGLWNNMNDAE
jgi:hypothetical protein